jgi:hypothetical protein
LRLIKAEDIVARTSLLRLNHMLKTDERGHLRRQSPLDFVALRLNHLFEDLCTGKRGKVCGSGRCYL